MLMNMYEKYSSNFSGTIIRDHKEYWKKWIKTESKNNAYLLEDESDIQGGSFIKGYIIVNIEENNWQVKDFCVEEYEFSLNRGKNVFNQLIYFIMKEKIQHNIKIIYPSTLFS